MQTAKKMTRARRRRISNRHASYYNPRNRMNTSYGQPVHISFYLNPVLDMDGEPDREKIIKLFNTECYG